MAKWNMEKTSKSRLLANLPPEVEEQLAELEYPGKSQEEVEQDIKTILSKE